MKTSSKKIFLTTIVLLWLTTTSLYANSSSGGVHFNAHCRANQNGFFVGGEIGGHFPVNSLTFTPYFSFSVAPYEQTMLLQTGPKEYYQLDKIYTMVDLGLRQEILFTSNLGFYLQEGLGHDGGYFKGTSRDAPSETLFQSETGILLAFIEDDPYARITIGGGLRANKDTQYPTFSFSFSLGL